jgi:thiol-disulfide isomerase/thioredoxin
MISVSRRTALLGLAAAAASQPGFAANPDSPVAHGILAKNPLALAFEKIGPDLPNVEIVTPSGVQPISNLLKGRTVLMPLWAEWCAPCLSELPDFALLQQKFGNGSFAILPILTASRKKWNLAAIAQVFGVLHATVFDPLMEYRLGDELLNAMAKKDGELALPCNLLIGPNGKIAGREIGRVNSDDGSAGAPPPKNGDPETVARAEAGQAQSQWGKDAGREFAAAMAGGFLT